ncbi:MAG: hypothetical protein VX444_00035 [Pseudomonadota bacterium]|nr:hypothetical protein [Pseudomonadota bacterium]
MKFGAFLTGLTCASVCALTAATAEEIIVSDAKLHIEGVDVAADGRIFVGSLVDSSVWMVSADGTSVSQFTEPGSLGMDSAVGVKVDERANELFVCSGPVLGVSHYAESAKEAGVLVYDLTTGAPLRRYDFPGGGFCNDIAFGPDGALYATDSFNPRILTLPPGASELTTFIENDELGGEGWVLNGLAVHFDTLYTVKETDGRMFAIDIQDNGKAGELNEVSLPRALNKPDGVLMTEDGIAYVVESGTQDVLRFDPKAADATWAQLGIEGLKVPATAAFMPDGALVIANTQNDHLMDEPGTTDPFVLTVAKLR